MRIRTGTLFRSVVMVVVVMIAATGCSKGQTKTPAAGGAASSAVPTLKVSVSNFTYKGMPDTLPRGQRMIEFTNEESFKINHEMVLMSTGGKTAADMIADAKKKDQAAEDDWLHFGEVADVGTGATKVSVFDLPPGDYVIACYQKGTADGKENGPTHITIGMIKEFKVT